MFDNLERKDNAIAVMFGCATTLIFYLINMNIYIIGIWNVLTWLIFMDYRIEKKMNKIKVNINGGLN